MSCRILGNVENPSYMPELQLPYVEPLSFKERVVNTIIYSLQVNTCLYALHRILRIITCWAGCGSRSS
jgi:hypothetical protein